MQKTFTYLCIGLLGLVGRLGWAQEAAPTLEFVENRGQWPAAVRYAGQAAPGARLFVENTGLTYALTAGLPGHGHEGSGGAGVAAPADPLRAHAVRVEFVAPDPAATLAAETGTEAVGQRHYLRGAAPANWAADVRAWHALRYRQLWPGTELVLHESPERQLEYDVLLAAGADPARVRLRYHGTTPALNAAGQLLLPTTAGQLRELTPRAWQADPGTGERRAVACAFEVQGSVVGFRLGAYDHRRPLTIDPVVEFASYTGSPVENWGFAATHDAAGNLYTAGVVFEPGYPVTAGAYQTTFAGNIDVAVMKFTTSANGPGARAWATYLGGDRLEFPHSMLVNGRGELLLLGSTSSTNYPTTSGALGRTLRGGPTVTPFGSNSPFVLTGGADLVLSRLSATGGRLRASTYLGGTGTDGLLDANAPAPRLRHNYGDALRGDLALDAQDNVYLASVTSSGDFPGLAAGAYRGGTSDGLVASLDSSLSRVRWATAVGGSGADAAYSLHREDGGGLLVAGGTTSPNLSGAAGGYRAAPGGGVDGFVARLTAAGALTQSTYLGTTAYDQAFFVRTGPDGKPVVLGQTLSRGAWPGLDTTRYRAKNGQQFLQQLAPDLRSAGYATVFGSGRTTTDFSPTAFGLDCYGRLALAGWGGGLDPEGGSTVGLPTTPGALQATTDGQDFYLMQLSDGARVLEYATFYGTTADDHVDGGTSRFDSRLTLYQALCACDQSNGQGIPIPPGANTYAPRNGAAKCNNAALKFAFPGGGTSGGLDTLSLCALGAQLPLGGSPAGGTWTGPGVTGSAATGFYFKPSPALVGLNVLTYNAPAVTAGCAGTATVRITVLPQTDVTLTAPQRVFCVDRTAPAVTVPLTGTPAGGTFFGAGVVMLANGTATFNPLLAGAGEHFVAYGLLGGRCPSIATLRLTVKVLPKPEVGPPRRYCLNSGAVPLGGSPPGGTWSGPGVGGSLATGFTFTPAAVGVGGPYLLIYSFPGDADCPPATDTLRVEVLPAGIKPIVPADTAFCLANQSFRLRGGVPAGGIWSGPGVTGSLATGFTYTASALYTGPQAIAYTLPTANCDAVAVRVVRVSINGRAVLSAPDTVLCAAAGPRALTATPPGGTWTGPGVSGSPSAGYTFTPSAALVGTQTLAYLGPPPRDPRDCPTAGTLRMQVLSLPQVTMQALGVINYCLAAPPHGIVLVGSPAGGTFSGPGVVTNRFNPADVGPGRYTITYTWNFPTINCPVTATQVVEVRLVPVPAPVDTVLCVSGVPVPLRTSPPGGVWSGPGVTPGGVFTAPGAGTTTLHYDLPQGCASKIYRITVPDQASTVASWQPSTCAVNSLAPRTVRFVARGPAAAQVEWDFGDGSAPTTGASVEHTYPAAGRYQPRAALPGAPAGVCPNELTLPPLEVQAAFIPNILLPNGDRQNQTFAPRVGGCPGRLQVFSRWGQKVLEVAEYHDDWTGEGLAAGIYYYLLERGNSASRIKGWVEIIR